jgi:putative membrane protein
VGAIASIVFVGADTWDMHDTGSGWWVLMMIGMVLFWALVVAGVVWLVHSGIGQGPRTPAKSASDTLDERLASGEISVEEYEQRRQVLRGGSGGG